MSAQGYVVEISSEFFDELVRARDRLRMVEAAWWEYRKAGEAQHFARLARLTAELERIIVSCPTSESNGHQRS